MTQASERLIADYLRLLDRELARLPRGRRREVVAEISDHIDEAQSGLDTDGETATLNLLERLGDPTDIAAEANARFGVGPVKAGLLEISALALLLVGGFLFGVGWLVGVALLWSSGVWSTLDKVIGTLVFPGGLALPLYLFAFEAASSSGMSTLAAYAGCAFLLVLVIGSISTTVYLARRMREQSTTAPAA
jgi:uncharacterized membrane protein